MKSVFNHYVGLALKGLTLVLLTLMRTNLSRQLLVQSHQNTKTMCETCSKLTIKTPKRRQCNRPGVFIVN